MHPVLAIGVDFASPLFWAVFIGWEMSVILHEFAHGVAAHFGGDYTIRERGGLTLNPLQYIDPFLSLVLPIILMLMGGVPLPGGVTYVRRDLLRNNFWQVAVSAAGPAMNFLLFCLLIGVMHPKMGWIDPHAPVVDWTSAQKAVGALAFLQLFAVFINLLPIPPLDGFQMLSPFLNAEARERFLQPSMAAVGFVVVSLIISNQRVKYAMYDVMSPIVETMGSNFTDVVTAARSALYGQT